MRIQENEKKRWKAVLTIKDGVGPYPDWMLTHQFNEILDLHQLIEQGPDWGDLKSITITYQLGEKDD